MSSPAAGAAGTPPASGPTPARPGERAEKLPAGPTEVRRVDRPWRPERPWYGFAARLLPAAPGRWVDLGCGRGEFLAIAANGSRRRGIGLDRLRADWAEDRIPGTPIVCADLEAPLPFRSGALDGASLIEVIEHVVGAEALVDELARVLRPGGWLIVSTPNVAHLTYRLRALTGHPPKQEGYHLRFFTERTLRTLLTARGFRIEARASFGKQALLTKLRRRARPRDEAARGDDKVRYRVPRFAEPLLAQHFVWRLVRTEAPARGA